MTPGQRAFFAGLAFSRAKKTRVDKVFSRFEYKLYSFRFDLDAEGNLNGFDPAEDSVVRGKLPLVQYMKNARHFSFEGERDIFQGCDLTDMTMFKIDVYPFWCRFHDTKSRAYHFYLLERQEGDEAEDWIAQEERAAEKAEDKQRE